MALVLYYFFDSPHRNFPPPERRDLLPWCEPAVALAWTMRSGNVIAIPESGSVAHVKENAVALSLTLTPQELQTLDATHQPPGR